MASSPIAYNLIRHQPHYRHDAFTKGLEACGFRVKLCISRPPQPEDVLVIWNRYAEWETKARQFEKAGAKVLVVENAYIPHLKSFAISLTQHHHGGVHVEPSHTLLRPQEGKHILICGQRQIGSELMKSPPEWAERTAEKLLKFTKKELRIRQHPGKHTPPVHLADDLRDCHACVVWSSACGVQALIKGVQVFYGAPRFIGEASAHPLAEVWNYRLDINAMHPFTDTGVRNAMANQWTVEQVSSGEAFTKLLRIV